MPVGWKYGWQVVPANESTPTATSSWSVVAAEVVVTDTAVWVPAVDPLQVWLAAQVTTTCETLNALESGAVASEMLRMPLVQVPVALSLNPTPRFVASTPELHDPNVARPAVVGADVVPPRPGSPNVVSASRLTVALPEVTIWPSAVTASTLGVGQMYEVELPVVCCTSEGCPTNT